MTCIQCFQKIAPSALEKSCKGEHRHQREGRKSENFHVGLKVWGRLCLPLGSPEPPPLTLHTHPLRLTPGLAHFGGWGIPCSLCICGRGGSPQPRPWMPSSVSEVGSLEDSVYPPELLMTCESSKAWQELVSRIWNFSLKACFSGASESAPLVFQEPCEQGTSIYCAAAERPVVQAPLPLRPAPFPLWWTCCSSLCSVYHRRHWDQEVKRAQKDAQEPSLMKTVIKCYWKSYLIWGMFTFLEVKDFHTVHCFLVYVSLY